MISSLMNQDFHVKPTLSLFPKSFSTMYIIFHSMILLLVMMSVPIII